ncbi:ATP-binding cassette domain-containing protein [Nonomuraea diastatica]|uniref:ABC transporter ATP-binding protein n=1 Tax=Nonomuraea diastatica TaxID=1848329 RepID=A0A4R4WWB1_9ACTN|nr:ABC transporter ATP-binding protein [Nonomuraea diastatica]TDD21990.1 ABC transporter ATP-binding protein [Nonomuraea diastatica]
MSGPLLEVRDLVVEYATAGGRFRAVDGVGFSVGRAGSLAIVGESGCGKSTIARALVRLLTPTSGEVLLDGQDLARMPERRLRPIRSRIQMVFQDPYGSLDPRMPAVDTVGEPLKLRGVRSRAEREREAARLLDRVGLPASTIRRRPAEFSGGQRQRIGIARALAGRPEVLVCDEATSALDVSVQAQVLALLNELRAEGGLTYVFISHNLGVVSEVSDEVLVMRAGRTVEHGPTGTVLAAPREPYTRALRAAALDPTTMRGRKPRDVLAAAKGATS